MDIKAALKRRITGDLTAVPGYEDMRLEVRPRKFSVQARDEINTLILPRSAAIRRLRTLTKGKVGAEEAEENEAELSAALKGMDLSELAMGGILRLQIVHGIESYKAGEDPEASMDEAFLGACLEDPSLAAAVAKIAQGYNAPLPKPTPETSGTSLNGSSEESGSTPM